MAVYPAGSYAAANSEYLNRADESALSMGSGVAFTILAWAYRVAGGAIQAILTKVAGEIGYTTLEYALRYISSDKVQFDVSGGTTSAAYATVLHTTATDVDTWYMIVATFDGSGTVGLSINAGAFQTATNASAYAKDSTGDLRVGRTGTPTVQYLTGRTGPCGIAKGYVLSAADITELYNGGNGRLWAQLSSGLQAKFGSCWWDMTETSGSRASWDGNMNLTDNNTVTYGDGPVLVPEGHPAVRRNGIWQPRYHGVEGVQVF